ncbi:MAG: GNAT family N-acetyltransferase [Bacteroidia bacterium]
MNLRPIHITDAEAYLDLLHQLDASSAYTLVEPGERLTAIREQMDEIRSIEASPNQCLLIVEDGDLLVAWIGAFGSSYRRIRHTVSIGIGVIAAYQRRGIGTWLFEELEAWAWKRDISRLELLVAAENKPAISLYRKMGFQIEGTKRESYRLDARLIDEYLMSKLLKKPVPPPHNPPPRW